MTPAVQEEEIHLFAIAPATEYIGSYSGGEGVRDFQGENRDNDAEITFWQKSLADEAPKVTITDDKGKVMTTLRGERFPGLQTVRWNLRQPAENGLTGRGAGFGGGKILFSKPGDYTVTLTLGKEKRTQKLRVTGPYQLSEEPTESEQKPGR